MKRCRRGGDDSGVVDPKPDDKKYPPNYTTPSHGKCKRRKVLRLVIELVTKYVLGVVLF
jgi:hypothetical protein